MNIKASGTLDTKRLLVGSGKRTWKLPLPFDPQINGYAGVDFQSLDLLEDAAIHAMESMKMDGMGHFFWTLITDDWSAIIQKIKQIQRWRQKSPESWKLMAGWHIEGPFLSDEAGYRGAHPSKYMRDPELRDLVELKQVVGSDPTLITLAPERSNAMGVIRHACQLGFRISLGHSNLDTEQLQKALSSGASGFTHLGNGCPPLLDRQSNNIWSVLDQPGLRIGLIPDGSHVSPALFRLIRKAYDPDCIYLTTDAMAAAATGPGNFYLGELEVEVGEDQVVRMPGTRQFAGSALRPMDGILRAAAMWRVHPMQVWPHVTSVPGRWLGVETEQPVVNAGNYCEAYFEQGLDGHITGMDVSVYRNHREINSLKTSLPKNWQFN